MSDPDAQSAHRHRNASFEGAPTPSRWNTRSMATRKVTITVPEELLESIKSRVDARGVSAYITAATAHQDAMDRLQELSDRLEAEYGPLDEQDMQAALDRIAAIDSWHKEQHDPGAAA